jgi:putative ABC transport system permease protein
MNDLLQDVRYATRLLIRQPGFTFVTIAVLALGIGATTAIFSVVDGVLLRPLPYAAADRLVSVANYYKKSLRRGTISAPDFHDWHDQARSFDALAMYNAYQDSISVDGAADYAVVSRTTPEFFDLMGARTVLGRLPSAEEQKAGGPMTAVVSYAFWQSHLGGDRSALGRTVKYGDQLYSVIGVLTPEFNFPLQTALWTPGWVVAETTSRSAHNYRAVGRLKAGVSVAQAQAEMDTIADRLERAYPQSNESKGVAVDLLRDQMVRGVRTTLNLIFGVVVVVLLIACANVSNLLLARASARARELGVRSAIGATRGRVVRQLITESALLAIVAGALGVLIAAWGIRGLLAIAPEGLPRLEEVGVNWRMLVFAMAASLSASLVFGVAPALQTSRVDLNEVLKHAGRGAAAGGGSRLRSALIVFETAAAVVLVIAATLLLRSFAALSHADMGFDTERLLLADTAVPWSDLDGARRAVRFYRDLLPQLAAIGGVQSVAGVSAVPTVVRSNGGYMVEGGATFEQMRTRSPQALFTIVTPHYFRTLGIALKRGRDFDDRDVEGATLTGIVNEAFVRAAFPGQDPIGRRIMTGLDGVVGPDGTRFLTIVGVAADLRARDPSVAPEPQIYHPFQQHASYGSALTIVCRTAGDPMQIATAAQQRIRSANPEVPVRIGTMDEALGTATSTPRFRTVLLGLFAALALVLAMAGVYGIVSFTVSQRTSEMGLRMALGAQRAEIISLTLASGLKLTAIGVVAGWLTAFAAARALESMLFDVQAHDPLVFGVAPAALLAVACLASMAPALRASRVDPSVALRVE